MFNNLLRRWEAFKRDLRHTWLRARVHVRRKVIGSEQPLELLRYCCQVVIDTPDFRLVPTMRNQLIFAPQPAEVFTEILSTVQEALANDKNAKAVFELGPFRDMTPFGFLTSREHQVLDSGVNHVVYHAVVIQLIAAYLQTELQEGDQFKRHNTRILSPMVEDFQRYLDSVIRLYE